MTKDYQRRRNRRIYREVIRQVAAEIYGPMPERPLPEYQQLVDPGWVKWACNRYFR